MAIKHKRFFDFLFLALLFLYVAFLNTQGFIHHLYKEDGLYSYAFIRNLAHGYGPWQGPIYGYLWGNHSYLTLLLFAPLIYLFDHPITLHYAGLAIGVAGCYYFYAFCTQLKLGKVYASLPFWLTLLYVLQPLTLDGLSGIGNNLFQPEIQMILLIMASAYYFFGRQFWPFVFCLFLMILVKEEYIPFAAIFLIWGSLSRYFYEKRIDFKWWKILVIFATFILASFISISFLQHFKFMNPYRQIYQNDSYYHIRGLAQSELFTWRIMGRGLWISFVSMVISVIPLSFFLTKKRTWIYWCACLFVFIFGRLATDRLIYGEILHGHFHGGIGEKPWSLVICVPMIFLSLALILAYSSKTLKKRKWALIFSLGFGLMSSLWLGYKNDATPYMLKRRIHFGTPLTEEVLLQMNEMRQHIPKGDGSETIIVPNIFLQFFYDYRMFPYTINEVHGLVSFIQLPYILDQCNWVILANPGLDLWRSRLDLAGPFEIVLQTKNFTLFKRNQKIKRSTEAKRPWW